MKRFVSLALAAAMTLSIAPVSALANTDNRVSGSPVVSKDDVLGEKNAPEIVIRNIDGDISNNKDLEFALSLNGAEFDDLAQLKFKLNDGTYETAETLGASNIKVSKYNGSKVYITIPQGSTILPSETDAQLKILFAGVKVTSDTAKVTIDGTNSVVHTSTHTFAKAADGNAIITVDGKKDFPDGGEVNDIIIEEVTNSSISTKDGEAIIKLKLNSGFKFGTGEDVVVVKGGSDSDIKTSVDGDRDMTITIPQSALDDGAISVLKITGIKIIEDGAKYGDTAEITVTGEKGAKDITKTTLEMGKYIDYGVNVSTEDKDLPIIYSGMKVDGDNNETLKLTVKESVEDSWFADTRKTTFTFPEGVKVQNIKVDSQSGLVSSDGTLETEIEKGIDGNVVTLNSLGSNYKKDGKKEAVLIFDLEVSPDFKGDITCEVGGPAVNENQKVTLAKAVAPITVEATKTPVSIDYRNVAVGDITLTEAEAGLWGKSETITLQVENMNFESGIKAEVVEGDGDIKKLDVNKTNGTVKITVDSESSKTPMKIKLSGISLYLERNLPVGDYALSLINDSNSVMFQTYNKYDGNKPDADGTAEADRKFGFDVDEVEVMKDYVTVTTAGRDQGTTFTTEVVVTIDSTTMKVDGKDVTLETPAYLSAEGWTMLPIRAVTEALATTSNTQPVDWIPGNPGTIIIRYGDKTVSMTLGSTTMYINGTPIPMSTAPAIVNDRAFLPMRDLGRALGLTENEIVWDAATRTATLNPATTTTNTTTNQ